MSAETNALVERLLRKCIDCGIDPRAFVAEKMQELEERKRILLTPRKKWFADNYSKYASYASAILGREIAPEELHGDGALAETTRRRFNPERREGFDSAVRRSILDEAKGRCTICGVAVTIDDMQVDHVLPISEGGSNHPLNLQATCEPCNLGKSSYFEDTAIAAARPWWEERTSLIHTTPKLSKTKRYCVLKRDQSRCTNCGATAQESQLVIILRVPARMGGQNVYDNLVTKCTRCS